MDERTKRNAEGKGWLLEGKGRKNWNWKANGREGLSTGKEELVLKGLCGEKRNEHGMGRMVIWKRKNKWLWGNMKRIKSERKKRDMERRKRGLE